MGRELCKLDVLVDVLAKQLLYIKCRNQVNQLLTMPNFQSCALL